MSVTAAVLAASLMLAPSDSKKDPPAKPGTLGSLQNRRLDLPPEPPLDAANDRARQGYEELLRQPQVDPRLAAEAMRRLADLELDNADLASSGEAQEQAYRKAAGLYRDLLRRYPANPTNDQVLYQLARAEEGMGDAKAALVSLGRLAEQYPQSPLVPEVQFRRGEALFAERRYRDAEAAFDAVVGLGEKTTYYEPALYKLGWSRYRQDDYGRSLDAFFQLMDHHLGRLEPAALEARVTAMPRSEREFVDDSLRAMALACLYLGSPKTIAEELTRRGNPTYGYLIYRSLAGIFLAQQRYHDAAQALTGFVEANPLHPQAPAFQIQAVSALEAGGLTKDALALRQDYVRRFGLDQTYWSGKNAAEQSAAIDYLRDSTWMLAKQHHALAQDAALPLDQRRAEGAAAAEEYRRYVRYFPKDPRAPEAQFLLGDLLYDVGDLPGAIAAYESAAYETQGFARSADAGYAALQAYEKREAQLQGEAQAAWRRQRLAAELRFAERFPDRPESSQVLSKAAAGLFETGELTTAVSAANRVAKDAKADVESRRVALRVIGHAAFDRQDYAAAEAAYLELQQLAPAGAAPDRDIAERLAAAIYRQGEQAQASGQTAQAAEHFTRVAEEAPEAQIRVTADYDAAMATLKSGNTAQAITLLLAFRDRYAGHELVPEVTRTLALTYEKTGQAREAAAELQRIAETPSVDAQTQRVALWHSAELLRPIDPQAAETTLRKYLERFPQPFDVAIEGYQQLIELAAARGDSAIEAAWSQRLVNFESNGGSQRTERSRALAARAALLPARAARDAYRAVALTLPLKTSLAAKRKRMEDALAAYARAADYGVAEVLTEATFETAELYHDLARALKQSERPRDLDAAALEQYDLLLDEQIFPFEDKAISIHEANARRAREGLYDVWVQKSYAELAGLAPGRYSKGELPELSVPVAAAGTPVPPAAAQAFDAAVGHLLAGNTLSAEAAFKTLARDYPALPGPTVNLALVYRQLNYPADEEAMLAQAVKKWPQFAPGHHQQGLWLRRRGRFAEADAAYARAIAADPGYLAAHYDRAVLNDIYLQRPEQALIAYEQYQSLLPQPDPQIGRWIVDLRRRSGAAAAPSQTPPATTP